MSSRAADVVVLGPEWPLRALLRAQLIEEGYEVVATDAWPIPRQYLRAEMKPRALVLDLQGLDDPRTVLDELHVIMNPASVIVVTALGTVQSDAIRRAGFHVVTRPTSVGELVAAVSNLLGPQPR